MSSKASSKTSRAHSAKPSPQKVEESKELPPLSKIDIDFAFDLLSKDGKRITRDDVSLFYKEFIAACLPPPSESHVKRDETKFAAWENKINREEMSRDALYNLLIRKPLNSYPNEELFDTIEPVDGVITQDFLKKFCKLSAKDGVVHKRDVQDIIDMFDLDKDGNIGFNDFMKMRGISKAMLSETVAFEPVPAEILAKVPTTKVEVVEAAATTKPMTGASTGSGVTATTASSI